MLRRIARTNGFQIKRRNAPSVAIPDTGFMIIKDNWIVAGEPYALNESEVEPFLWTLIEQEPVRWFHGWRQLTEYNKHAAKSLHCQEWLSKRGYKPKKKAVGEEHKVYFDGKWRDYTLYTMDEVEKRGA